MNPLTRRTFLGKTALAAGTALTARFQPSALSAPAGANEAIRLGVIGLNGKGSAHLKNLLKMAGVRVAGLCDVDPRVLARVVAALPNEYPKPFQTTNARELIARPDIDAVMIVTSNHWHALLTVWACQAGKDVYVEKPMSRTVWEGRKMIEAAAKYNRIVQVGTHYRSETGLADAIKYLHAGELGKIHHIRAVVYSLRLSIGRKLPWYPEGLNYDLFCGSTPMRPLERNKLHYDWHWTWDTGNGELGNNGVHVLDIALRIARHNGPPRRRAVLRDAQRDVEHVHPVVAELAVAGVPLPVPVVVQVVALERPHRRRPAEAIIVQSLWIPRQLAADGRAQVVDDGADVVDLSELPLVQVLDRLGQAGLRAVMRADLDDAVVLRGRLDHLASLPHRARHRLFDVDVLAGLAGPDG